MPARPMLKYPMLKYRLPPAVVCAACLAVLSGLFPARGMAAGPEIASLSVNGFQKGTTTRVVISGKDLLPAPKLLGFPMTEQQVQDGATASRVTVDVTLAADVPSGLYNLRLSSGKGISPPRLVAVDSLPQLAADGKVESLPIALSGTVTGSTVLRIPLVVSSGQSLQIETEAQRLGSPLRPVLHLYRADGQQLSWSMGVPWLGGDARLQTVLPEAGEYTLTVHDLEYAGAGPGHFRLKIGEFQYADLAFPPAVQRGKSASISLIGNLPQETQLQVSATQEEDYLLPAWPEQGLPTGWRPPVQISSMPELLESTPAADAAEPQTLPAKLPLAVSGRLDEPRQEDVYRLPVAEGTRLKCEIFADRLGAPVDASLEIRNTSGGRLAFNDDTTSSPDPAVEYTVPAGTTAVDLVIRDQAARGGPACIYRLVLTGADETSAPPGFDLLLSETTSNVPEGGSRVLQVTARRRNYNGPVQLTVTGLPAGISADGLEIPAGAAGTLITLPGGEQQQSASLVTIRGASVGIDPPVTAVAVHESHPLATRQSWLARELGVAVTARNPEAIDLAWAAPPAETPLTLGSTLKLPLQINRPPGVIGPVRLSLVSSEPVPMTNGRPNANLALRGQAATVVIPVNPQAKAATDALAAAEKTVTDLQATANKTRETGAAAIAAATKSLETAEQALAAASTNPDDKPAVETARKQKTTAEAALAAATAAAEKADQAAAAALKTAVASRDAAAEKLKQAEAAIDSQAEFGIIIPPTLEMPSCDLSVKAEVLSLDSRTVLAEVYSPVRRLEIINPLGISPADKLEASAPVEDGKATTVTVSGTIVRRNGFAGDVTVTVEGQPAGVAAPRVVLRPDTETFELKLSFPATFKPGTISGIRLTVSGPPDSKQAGIVVKNDVPVTVTLLPAGTEESAEKKP